MGQYLERDDGGMGLQRSPGGFEFGIQGFAYAEPIPSSITFFLDNTAMVCDQYGRPIRGVVMDGGAAVFFATSPPDGIRADEKVTQRPQFATHVEVVAALLQERLDVLYEMDHAEDPCPKCRGKRVLPTGGRCPGCRGTGVRPSVSVAGWPQLPAEQLKKLRRLPPTPVDDLSRIEDRGLREAALEAVRLSRTTNKSVTQEAVAAAE